jgi:hypothetical protein
MGLKQVGTEEKAPSAFMIYLQEVREAIKSEHPEWDVGEISKEVRNKWKELNEEEKQIYKDKASTSRSRSTSASNEEEHESVENKVEK